MLRLPSGVKTTLASLALPAGWAVRAWQTDHVDGLSQHSRGGWLLTDPDGNDYYAATLARVRVLLAKLLAGRSA